MKVPTDIPAPPNPKTNIIFYITVQTTATKYDADQQSKRVIDLIDQGFEILSAAGDGHSVHYILIKYISQIPDKADPEL